ncbi:hypothetical protein [Burkholderia sp. Ac-20379]|uniref:hypothetical protein n=1 Tax=Burkholderia sp. Ac-20379 TaxID=2703900 RepID=UPI001F122261|nr:hypothetical protein [Burkholderia sp. Ac-20379]
MAALSASGDTRTWSYEPERERLVQTGTANGKSGDIINFPNLYREYVDMPKGGRAECLRNQVAGMRQAALPSAFAEARARLRPVIRSTTERGFINLQRADRTPADEIAHRPLCESLEIGIAHDGEFNIQRLNNQTLADWGVTFDAALEIAVDNLRAESSKPWLPLRDGVFVSQYGDFYDAARLLLTDVLYRQPIAGAPVVMAPNRTVLLLTGDRNEAGLQTLLAVAEEALREPRPLPPLMLRWSGTAWEHFVPEPLARKLHELRLQERAADYADQRTMLEERHATEGRDVFVATYTVVQNDAGRQRSLCVWTEGVHTLLPDTEVVALHQPATKRTAFLPRHEVQRCFGALLKPTDHLPIRYEAERFPEAGQVEAWFATHGKLADLD